jgi:predicted ATP-grasp superfamily ATP-dependent carboligase
MSELVEFWEKPAPNRYMIAGWHQWADAGAVSSGLPQYLIEYTDAHQIGEMLAGDFYLFQIPGTHHLLRPVVKLDDGYREGLEKRSNEFYLANSQNKEFVIFYGEEPHRNEELYADAFFDAVEELGIKRVASIAGVYGAVPYDKDRSISCVYSLPEMHDELSRYAVRFSNYDGGATISMYLAAQAEARGIEFFRFCALVPSYDLATTSVPVQSVAIGEDYKAWYDLMIRLNHMFELEFDLSDLETHSAELISEWHDKIEHITRTMPQLEVGAYMEQVYQDFTERSFVPLSDVWEQELRDLLDDFDPTEA